MKVISILVFLSFLLPNFLFAQLTIETVTGKKRTKNIPVKTKIGLKMPTQTANNDCNCCHMTYTGILDSIDTEYASLNLLESNRVFVDERGINQFHNVRFEAKAIVPTNIPLNSLKAVTVFPKSRETLRNTGYTLLLVTTIQSLVINPFLDGKNRRIGNAAAATGFLTGLVFSILPNKKTYYFEQPPGSPKRLWRLKK
ncbi:MAG: hypothetical protein K9J37_00485 [Saprospiraceae bacterium]|nr:hypothetical protein [Saprospiraceae bacterium]MCF8248350.1 hypothetical protein [Saprospiraceae bacterium]MCF8280211.1 hypothetical protein [Bacteroidales bacterium]MCF8309878.1 hypothetical protein [Saprospiraceae bacterium]MCF8438791.1 hypothetical protein [Saprospiraceae bacterium]